MRSVRALALLAGVGGLGSETVLLKVVDHTVGHMPLAGPAVVACFILCAGLGALASPRFARPWAIEVGSAVLQLALTLGMMPLMALAGSALGRAIPLVGPDAAAMMIGAIVTAPFAFLLGVTLPVLIEASGDTASTYGTHALGAVIGVLAVEAVLYPTLGLAGCTGALALIHGITAAALFSRVHALVRQPIARLPMRLIVIGASTGAIQGSWLLYAQILERPYYFVAPAVVAAMLAGLHLGARLWRRLRFGIETAVLAVIAGSAASIALTVIVAGVKASQVPWLAALEVVIVVLPCAIPIGAVIPAFLGDTAADRARAGAAMLAISIGNAIGLTALTGALSAVLAAPMALAASSALACAALGRRWWQGAGIALLGVGAAALVAENVLVARSMGLAARFVTIDRVFRAPGEVSAIFRADGRRQLYQTGYQAIDLDSRAESVIGAVGLAYAPRYDRALVIGVGSGRTAGAVATVFASVDAVDLGATVDELCRALSDDNFQLLDREGVRLHRLDGLLAPAMFAPGYDLIVQTVDPGYHALAAKLYTVEHLARLEGLLAPDGVLVFWSDPTVSPRANQVLVNTGRAVFPHQKLFSAFGGKDPGYFFLVHGREPLVYDPRTLRFRFTEDARVRALPLFGGRPPGEIGGVPPISFEEKEPDFDPKAPDGARLLTERFDPTEDVHSFARPERSILFGGLSSR